MTVAHQLPSMRRTDGGSRVTPVELFFDLVYVFAVTQLSHLLVEHPTVRGALQAAVLLAMIWQVWVYTTWCINYLDPTRSLVRGMLLALMFGSLLLAAAIPEAFHEHGLLVAMTFVVVQAGRSLVAVFALRGEALQRVFVRVLPWTAVTGVVLVAGALAHGDARIELWAAAVVARRVVAAGGGGARAGPARVRVRARVGARLPCPTCSRPAVPRPRPARTSRAGRGAQPARIDRRAGRRARNTSTDDGGPSVAAS